MSRHDESIGRMPNPAQHFLEWNSEKSSFCYYSSESAERIPFPLPFNFVCLKFVSTITGYDEDAKEGIYANEVTDQRYEHFRVMRRGGSVIATGLYSDIKDEVNHYGGRFTLSIYAMTAKGAIVNIKLRGGQMINFDVIKKHGKRWKDEFIQVAKFDTKQKKDSEETYTLPVFSFGGSLSPADAKKTDRAYELVKEYFATKSAQAGTNNVSRPASNHAAPAAAAPPQPAPAGLFASDGDDDLPF